MAAAYEYHVELEVVEFSAEIEVAAASMVALEFEHAPEFGVVAASNFCYESVNVEFEIVVVSEANSVHVVAIDIPVEFEAESEIVAPFLIVVESVADSVNSAAFLIASEFCAKSGFVAAFVIAVEPDSVESDSVKAVESDYVKAVEFGAESETVAAFQELDDIVIVERRAVELFDVAFASEDLYGKLFVEQADRFLDTPVGNVPHEPAAVVDKESFEDLVVVAVQKLLLKNLQKKPFHQKFAEQFVAGFVDLG